MKRSRIVTRVLLSSLTASAITACVAAAAAPRVTTESFYTTDEQIPGAGFYHAPFRGFFRFPYNHFDAQRKEYFFGGQWADAPHRSIVNISAPTAEAAKAAEAMRTDISRGSGYVHRSGFGSTSGSNTIRS